MCNAVTIKGNTVTLQCIRGKQTPLAIFVQVDAVA